MPAVAEAQGAVLRDYGGEGPEVLFVPSLINPPISAPNGRFCDGWLAAAITCCCWIGAVMPVDAPTSRSAIMSSRYCFCCCEKDSHAHCSSAIVWVAQWQSLPRA